MILRPAGQAGLVGCWLCLLRTLAANRSRFFCGPDIDLGAQANYLLWNLVSKKSEFPDYETAGLSAARSFQISSLEMPC